MTEREQNPPSPSLDQNKPSDPSFSKNDSADGYSSLQENDATWEQEQQSLLAKEQQSEPKPKKKQKIRIRLIPIWLRTILFCLLLLFTIAAGLITGYSIIGDGKLSDALSKETWQHIIDLVVKEQ